MSVPAPKKRYTPPKPAPLPEDYEEFYATLTEAERELDELAKKMLGSSYFIQWAHIYLKWSKTKADKTKADKTNAEKAKAEKAAADKTEKEEQEEKKE